MGNSIQYRSQLLLRVKNDVLVRNPLRIYTTAISFPSYIHSFPSHMRWKILLPSPFFGIYTTAIAFPSPYIYYRSSTRASCCSASRTKSSYEPRFLRICTIYTCICCLYTIYTCIYVAYILVYRYVVVYILPPSPFLRVYTTDPVQEPAAAPRQE